MTTLRVVRISLPMVIAALLGINAAATSEQMAAAGVVIEELSKDSALAKAGIQPGDVILAWRRLPSPPANSEQIYQEITSVFDWHWLALEQAPRGPLQLIGFHEEEKKTFVVSPGQWDDDPWPWMPKETLSAFRKKRQEYSTAEKQNEIEIWWEEKATHEQQWHLRSWLLARLGKMRAARGAWDDAFAAYGLAMTDVQNPFAESVLWWELGQLRQRHNDLDQAREAYTKAEIIREKTSPQGSLSLAAALNDLGVLAWERGDLAQADDIFQRSLRIRQALAPGSLWLAQTLNDLGLIAADRRQLDRAADFFQRSLLIFQALMPDSIVVATNLNNLALVATNRRDFDQATEIMQRALKIQQALAPESLDIARTFNNLGSIAAMQGDLRQVEENYKRALEIRQKVTPGSIDTADTLNNLGMTALARGDLDLAMDFHQQALEIRQKLAPESLKVAESLYNMGLIAERQKELQRARDLHKKALSVRQQLAPDSLDVANSLNSLAIITEKSGALDQAAQLHQKALEIRLRIAPDTYEVANSLNNLGHTAMQAGQLERAEGFHLQALDILTRRAARAGYVAASLSSLGDIAARRGDWPRAVSFYQRSLKIQKQIAPGTSDLATNLHDLGIATRMLNPDTLGASNDLFLQALDALESQLARFGSSQDSRAEFRAGYKSFYQDAIDTQRQLGKSTQAFLTLERSRARSFLDQLAERDIIFSADIPETLDRERRLLALKIDRAQRKLIDLDPHDHSSQIDELQDQLRRLRDDENALEGKIRRASAKLAALRYPQPLDLESTRAALDPGTLLLSYSVGEKEVLLFSLSRGRNLRIHTLSVTRDELRDQVRDLLSVITSTGPSTSLRAHRFETLARNLEMILVEPVADRVAAANRLLIVPDGPLHLLPWGALIRGTASSAERQGGRSWRYLMEWKPLSTILSATLFAEIKKERPNGQRYSPRGIVVFGDPIFPHFASSNIKDLRVRSVAQRGFNFEPLPATRSEAQQIASLFPQATIYLGNDATEQHAKSLPHDTRIVHFATHSTLDERFPLNSAVVLSIPEKFEEGKDNGLLQAWEIFEKVRIDADLVVLSACESGLGKEMGGEGLIGLTRAFQYAGARSVMASLWKISDRTTAELMVRFYKHLKAGLPKDEALRAAQMELIQGPIRIKNEKGEEEVVDASAPYYWAAFQIYGDWQ